MKATPNPAFKRDCRKARQPLNFTLGVKEMDPTFIATPSESAISAALSVWPELASRRIRPLLVTAFGDIYVETDAGEVLAAKPIELECVRVCGSVEELQQLFSDAKWAEENLITNLALLAKERGTTRQHHQVFAFAPHPSLTGKLRVENLMPMDINVWHHICSQLRGAQQGAPGDAPKAARP